MNLQDIVYAAGFLIVAAYLIFNTFVNYLNSKRAKLHGRHARLLNDLNIIDKYAAGIVAAVAVDPNFTISDSKGAAISALDKKLQSVNISANADTLSRAVENAYQDYKAAGKDTHVANQPFDDNTVDKVLDGKSTSQSNTDKELDDKLNGLVDKVADKVLSSLKGSGK